MLLNLVFVFCLGIGIRFVNGNCSPCPPPPKHYEEFKCTGITLQQGQCCAVKYLCPNLSELDSNKCYYNGNSYNKGQTLSQSNLPLCFRSCICVSDILKTTDAAFSCLVNEPEPWQPNEKNCVRQYSLGKCNSVSEVCGEENIKKLGKCFWRGKQFYEGERFSPESDPCYACICNEDFDNSTYIEDNTKSCAKINCGLELLSLDKVKRGCAPIYYGEKSCCPIDWKCPEDDTNSLVEPELRDRADMTCTFGDLTLQHWDALETNDKCLRCSCDLPPLVSCIREPNCSA